jgi:hypothetical protein
MRTAAGKILPPFFFLNNEGTKQPSEAGFGLRFFFVPSLLCCSIFWK